MFTGHDMSYICMFTGHDMSYICMFTGHDMSYICMVTGHDMSYIYMFTTGHDMSYIYMFTGHDMSQVPKDRFLVMVMKVDNNITSANQLASVWKNAPKDTVSYMDHR